MLPKPTQRELLAAIERGLDARYAGPYVVVETQDPDRPRVNVNPTTRWRWGDVDVPNAPYTLVTLQITNAGIPDAEAVGDATPGRDLGREDISDGPQDADAVAHRGRPVHDELSIMVTAQGTEDFGDRLSVGVEAGDRAGAVCRAVRKFLLERFSDAPLDVFDREGNLVDRESQIYGEDLTPPVTVSPIAGRGARNTTEQVDASGAQYNGGVNLHYMESSERFEFTPTKTGVDTVLEE